MLQSVLTWLRPAPEEELRATIQAAVDADRQGRWEDAVELYSKGIEKMMEQLKDTTDDEARKHLRLKIHEYMTRAEFLKDHRHPNRPGTLTSTTPQAHANTTKPPPPAMSGFIKSHPQLAHTILDEVLDRSPGVQWDDVVGLSVAKQILQEAVILPMLRPDLFTGLRSPVKGVLLFGPPGTGKTMLAKAVATESKATFFNISASTLTSKWVGEGEKLVRVLFAMARELQPSVIFLDEMDALLGSRSASEHDASRRIKNQFFTELDGAASSSDERILVMGATNLPQELDEAIIRRMEKRVYVPLPDADGRASLIRHLLHSQKSSLSRHDLSSIVKATDGYSGSDLKAVCKDAALGPIRELGSRITNVRSEDIRGINAADFHTALQRVRASVSAASIRSVEVWNEEHGVSAGS
ncbi:hypothetical protein Poli38472_000537 [Pythium oligandrum]|uniref:microtubule-severing ATPase n=1 Tax=Pythium oligandrum TaxID=41045 RepID=A0A8K1FEF8_PYTOL|nr:hypothetical protein Poli38472_000537 [Pythium oligandrum]|eukprot:TMW60495.1 hypothetical protein Poli38472_000537 [Pythium oligandrum]